MKRLTIVALAILVASLGTGLVFASDGFKIIKEHLTGLKEVPVISTVGEGSLATGKACPSSHASRIPVSSSFTFPATPTCSFVEASTNPSGPTTATRARA